MNTVDSSQKDSTQSLLLENVNLQSDKMDGKDKEDVVVPTKEEDIKSDNDVETKTICADNEITIIKDDNNVVNTNSSITNVHELKTNHKADNTTIEQSEKDNKKEVIKTDKDISSTDNCAVNDSQDSTVKETPGRGNTNIKRKRKNTNVQEKDSAPEGTTGRNKRKKSKNDSDRFCWRCHKESVEGHCSACSRSWHRKCIGGIIPSSLNNWICGECAAILKAENAETCSKSMAQLSVDQLCMLLKHVVERMRDYPGSEPFWKPVEILEVPNYLDYVVKPMDLNLLESNVRAKLYGSTDAFMADAKWIQHNCIVFNTCGGVYTDTSKLTNAAKQIIKIARQEVSEIEACPDCYAHGRNLPRPQPSWFIEPCHQPHVLVWAKLKGFPFWPAKAMPRVNSQGFVDVRFFGAHDRAWVSPRDLYLYSEDPPTPLPRKRRVDMDECVKEITRHCRKLELVFGKFKFAPPKVQYNPNDPMQVKLLLPNYDPLQPNNSSQHTLKKKIFVKKRTPLPRAKSQSDLSSAIIATSVNDLCITSEKNESIGNISKMQETKSCDDIQLSSQLKNHPSPIGRSKLPNRNSKQTCDFKEDKLKAEQENTANKVTDGIISRIRNGDLSATRSNKLGNKQTDDKSDTQQVRNIVKPSEGLLKQNTFVVKPLTSLLKHNAIITEDTRNVLKQEKGLDTNSCTKKSQISTNTTRTHNSLGKVPTAGDKVYKPKTRMVDKINAEKALKLVSGKKRNESASSNDEGILEICETSTISTSGARTIQSSPYLFTSDSKKQSNCDSVKTAQSSLSNSSAEQSVALLLVVNNAKNEAVKHSAISSASNTRSTNVFSVTKPESKNIQQSIQQRKESKARKSFPNRPSSHIIPISPLPVSINSSNPIVCTSAHTEHSTPYYQLAPPEAGPLSAKLYNDAQELAIKMAQLMEEAYKEAARLSDIKQDEVVDTHQATVHFLKLQIERMRWQHQQELTELKHNTDRVLREMRASLEAERLRAVEETRREAEEERIRCVEEIKRKQWCASCGREALFYCCWNTAYCDYPCQQSHWPTHMRTCAQQPSFTTIVASSAASSHQQQESNANIQNSSGKRNLMTHTKISRLPTSLYISCTANECSQDLS